MDVPLLLLHIVGSIVCTPLQPDRDGLLPILSEKMSELDPWYVHPYKWTEVDTVSHSLSGNLTLDPWYVDPYKWTEVDTVSHLLSGNLSTDKLSKDQTIKSYSCFKWDPLYAHLYNRTELDPWCVNPYKWTDVKKIHRLRLNHFSCSEIVVQEDKLNLNRYSCFELDTLHSQGYYYRKWYPLYEHLNNQAECCQGYQQFSNQAEIVFQIDKLNLNRYSCFEWDPWYVHPYKCTAVNTLDKWHLQGYNWREWDPLYVRLYNQTEWYPLYEHLKNQAECYPWYQQFNNQAEIVFQRDKLNLNRNSCFEIVFQIDKLNLNRYSCFEWDPWYVHPYKCTDIITWDPLYVRLYNQTEWYPLYEHLYNQAEIVFQRDKLNLNRYSCFELDLCCVHPYKWTDVKNRDKLNINSYSCFKLDKWHLQGYYWRELDPCCVHPYKWTDVKKWDPLYVRLYNQTEIVFQRDKFNLNRYSCFELDPWYVHPYKWTDVNTIDKLNLNGYSRFQWGSDFGPLFLKKESSSLYAIPLWTEVDTVSLSLTGIFSIQKETDNFNINGYSCFKLEKLNMNGYSCFEVDKWNINGYSCFQDYSQSSKECVGKCPTYSEYKKITLETCADFCGMEDGNCAYHCLCDSSKARLVECSAKPEILFEYSNSHHKLPRITYCYHETTLMTETTGMNDRDSQQVRSLQNLFPILLFAVVGIIVAFVILPKCGIYSGTLSFASIIFPSAGATELGSGQRDQQDHSQIIPTSLKNVSKCPNFSEYMNKTLEKCVDVCKSYIKDGNCEYHCMRDSSKTTLVEFCAKPKILFDYCPEFDPVHQTIQKDQTTLCNPKLSLSYYNSSNIYFCDPKNCLHLSTSSDRSVQTTLSALMTGTTEMNGGEIQEVGSLQNWILILLSVVVVIFAASVIVFILRRFGIFSVRPRNKHYQEDEEKKIKKVDNETAETHLSNRNHPHPKNTHIKKKPNTPPYTHTYTKQTNKKGGKTQFLP